jgi:hypothetical protein
MGKGLGVPEGDIGFLGRLEPEVEIMGEGFSPGRGEGSVTLGFEISEMLLVGFRSLDEGIKTLGEIDHILGFVHGLGWIGR